MSWMALGDIPPWEQNPVLRTPNFLPILRKEGVCRGYYFCLAAWQRDCSEKGVIQEREEGKIHLIAVL